MFWIKSAVLPLETLQWIWSTNPFRRFLVVNYENVAFRVGQGAGGLHDRDYHSDGDSYLPRGALHPGGNAFAHQAVARARRRYASGDAGPGRGDYRRIPEIRGGPYARDH